MAAVVFEASQLLSQTAQADFCATTCLILDYARCMAFPTNWLQSYIQYPFYTFSFQPIFQQWWIPDRPIPGTFYPPTFVDAVCNWFLASVGQYCMSPLATSRMGANIYYTFGSSVVAYSAVASVGINWNVGDSLPLRKCAVIQRSLKRWGRSDRGRFYMPGISPSAVDGDRLTQAAWIAFNNVSPLLTTQLSVGGVLFSPVLVSYELGTATLLETCSVNYRLGNVMRRRNTRPNTHRVNYTYIPPPP